MDNLEPRPSKSNPWRLAIVTALLGFFAGFLVAPRQTVNSGAATSASGTANLVSSPQPTERQPIVLTLTQNGQSSQIVGYPLVSDPAQNAIYTLGSSDAKITMIEFGDYRCGYCHLFTTQTFPRIHEQYIKTGKLRYIYRDTISVGGEQTVTVASVAACMNEQNKFWDFHQMAHAESGVWGNFSGTQLISTLAQMSTRFGVDKKVLETCATQNKYASRYTAEVELSKRFGVSGTPSFIINGYFFSGALPFEVYQEIFKQFGV
jgi:protein-disulfide isomerase